MKNLKTNRMARQNPGSRQAGFSLIELMVVILLLSIIMGSVFSQIDLVQKRYRSEENKLDIFQTAREFMDQMIRDVHQAGFPNTKMYASGVLTGSGPYNPTSSSVAVGLVQFSTTTVMFEGDIDFDGTVDSVAYTLVTDTSAAGNENCPCIRRSQVAKADGTMPISQVPLYRTQVENVSVTNVNIFTPYDINGNAVAVPSGGWTRSDFNPEAQYNVNSNDPITNVWAIQINITVQSPTADIGAGNVKPQVFLTATAQVRN